MNCITIARSNIVCSFRSNHIAYLWESICYYIKPLEIVFHCLIVLSSIPPPSTSMSILCELQLISLMAATCCLKIQNTAFTNIQNDQIIVISFNFFYILFSPPIHFPKRIESVSLYRFMILNTCANH
jgi:hypothetical protein